jgi:glycosyltransferase involved in cell wall biosynthesis
MDCRLPWADAKTGKVVHVVGHGTDDVFGFLGPATAALARSGLEQTVVMIDDARYRHHLPNLHESAQLLLTPSMRNPVKQWRAVIRACRRSVRAGPLHAVHLHGFLPCLVGAYAVRTAGLRAPVFYSPHGSRSLGSLRTLGAPALYFVRPLLHPLPRAAIVSASGEALALESWESVALVENPASEVFHKVPRNEAWHPLIVTGGRIHDVRSVELFAQLAVLLGGEDLRISFNWIGAVDEVSRLRLTAANVGVFEVASDAERAARLAAGWIYVALSGTRGFPLPLVEAMAVGLPCVATDCQKHREVLRDGDTGFLCQSEREMIERIAVLVDSSTMRARVGNAARDEARRRFGQSRFNADLLAAYSASASYLDGVKMLGLGNR